MNNPYAARTWRLAHGRSIELGPKSVVMGILNVTPDSFSDGGKFNALDAAIARADQMLEEGATIIDVGGESTRPGANPVSAEEECARILPVIEALAAREPIITGKAFIAVDTYRADTARKAIAAGAHIVNDVWGFQKDTNIAGVVAESGAGCVLMHNGRERERLDDVIADQKLFLQKSLEIADKAQVARQCIVLDPGFGFAKDVDDNLQLLARLNELDVLEFPVLTGTSRKRFIGHFTGDDLRDRDYGTIATSVFTRMQGSLIFRVHEVAGNVHALAMIDVLVETIENNFKASMD